jgi:hypothetical protein
MPMQKVDSFANKKVVSGISCHFDGFSIALVYISPEKSGG